MKPEPVTDRASGIYRGRSIARRYLAPDGVVVLVGRSDADNDLLTFKLGRPTDFWLHVAGESGSHVLVLNEEGADRLSRETQQLAASLAARHSKARGGGQVAVHLARLADVSKPRGAARGKVAIRRFSTVHAKPYEGAEN